jgi:hypothetical protein
MQLRIRPSGTKKAFRRNGQRSTASCELTGHRN